LKSFSLNLTERPAETAEPPEGRVWCGFELKYLLEFETEITNDSAAGRTDLQKLQSALIPPRLRHIFFDADNAVIPFSPHDTSCHIVGGTEAITGGKGDAFRVLVMCEKMLRPNHPEAQFKDVFTGENYLGEHPLKRATRFVVSLR